MLNPFSFGRGAVAAAAVALAACSNSTAPSSTSRASLVNDPANDFIPSFTGAHTADLDVRSMEVTYNGTNYHFTGTMAGNAGSTLGSFYVWGVNRGAGTARFGSIATNVLFDFVVIVNPAGGSSVRDFITGVATPLPPTAVSFTGPRIDVDVPASLMPAQGFAADAFTTNLWPRTGLASSSQIADFAPDNSNAPVRRIP